MSGDADPALETGKSGISLAELSSPPRRWGRPLTRRARGALILGVATAIVVAGVGYYFVSREANAPPFGNLAWQVPNPGINILDQAVAGSLYVVNELTANLSGNSTILLRSITIDTGNVAWQITRSVLYFPGGGPCELTVVGSTVVFAYYQQFEWNLVVDLFNESTGALSGNASLKVNHADEVSVEATGANLYFAGIESAASNESDESSLTFVTDAFTIEGDQVLPAWNVTTWLGYADSFGTDSSSFLLNSEYAVGWIYQFGKVAATNLSTGVTKEISNNPFETPFGALAGDELFDIQQTGGGWELGQFNLTTETSQVLFTLTTGGGLAKVGPYFLIESGCGFVGFADCSANLSAYSDSGSLAWEENIDGSVNPASSTYSVFLPTSQSVLFVGTPNSFPGPDGSTSSYDTVFVLVSLDSGQVLDRVSYSYSVSLPSLSAGSGSPPPVLYVYTAADDRVIYSYGSSLAASEV